MAIPETQLSKWSDHGPQEASIRTHEAIRKAIDAYEWPDGMTHDFYLQGSYHNDTNLTGDSDVDVVLELTSTTYRGGDPAFRYFQEPQTANVYSWDEFRREALKALERGFGKKSVAQHNKSIRIKGSTRRLLADVVVCARHRYSHSFLTPIDGITLFALREGRRQIINYPKQHHENGVAKTHATGDLSIYRVIRPAICCCPAILSA